MILSSNRQYGYGEVGPMRELMTIPRATSSRALIKMKVACYCLLLVT